MDAADKAKEDVVKPAPKSRGRPAGSKDNKPRIKRVPFLQPPPQPQEIVANDATPNKSRKRLKFDARKSQKVSPKRSVSNTRKKSQWKSPRLLRNLLAHCTKNVFKPLPCRDDKLRKLGKITLSEYSTISWASNKWQTDCWNSPLATSKKLLGTQFVVACSCIAQRRHELLC